jgi:hypothetical protein
MGEKKSDQNSATAHSGIKRRDLWLGSTSLVAASAILPGASSATTTSDNVLPKPEPAFQGTIGTHGKGLDARPSEGRSGASQGAQHPVDPDR